MTDARPPVLGRERIVGRGRSERRRVLTEKRTMTGVAVVTRLGLGYVQTTEDTGRETGGKAITRQLRRRMWSWPAIEPHVGHRVKVTARLEPWRNNLGFYVDRPTVECADEAEHVLNALGALRTTQSDEPGGAS